MRFSFSMLTPALAFFACVGVTVAAGSAPAAAAAMLVFNVQGDEKQLTREEFDAIEQIVVNTANDFSDGVAQFEGPRARDVFAAVGAPLEGVGAFVAANDYRVEIPLEDFVKYDVIFATSMNGQRLSLRDKGPIWIVYPMTDHQELRDPTYNARLIWQLVKIELK